ncbi:MAG: class I tRNA ligase family protein, partial [Verrucomicrobiae bacterium]|nr:class I tRNA ligase family protein [Verrucomicrobiae bacterium]
SSVDWQNEVPFGEDLFKQTAEPYRRFRNVLRILLANLSDFDAANDSVDDGQFTLIDRWILERLNSVVSECRAAYAEYEFRKVFNTLNQFCAVDLSALYVDMTKDRMYCDAANSPRRRATQTAMHRVFESVAKLLAPILAYTADEAWEFAGHTESIHLEIFPEPDSNFSDGQATGKIELLHKVRDEAQIAIDEAIKAGQFRKRERAGLTIEVSDADPVRPLLENHREEVLEFLMVSDYQLGGGAEFKVRVAETDHPECPRCRRSLAVGAVAAHPDLCDRCADVMNTLS